jgi:hypothetical protein
MLASAAGLAGAGAGAMGIFGDQGVPETTQDYPLPPAPLPPAAAMPESVAPPATPHLLKHIRVVRQVKVGDDVVEESVAEAYIDPDEDPEPVRERLREQLRREAEAKQSGTANSTDG